MSDTDPQTPDLDAIRQAIASGDPVKAMPAITQLRHCSDAEAVPLLKGTQQKPFWCVRAQWIGLQAHEQGWNVLSALITDDEDPNVGRGSQCPGQLRLERAWPLLRWP